MKKIKKIITLILCLVLGLNVLGSIKPIKAYTREGEIKRTGYFEWNYLYNEDGTIEGVKITSFGPRTDAEGMPIEEFETPTELIYPESIEGYKVIAIDATGYWFGVRYQDIKKTIVPQYVQELTRGSWCGELVIADNNKYYCCENQALYNIDKTKLISYWGEDKIFSIPDTVKIIGEGALSGSRFDTITIPKNVEIIEEKAFYGAAINQIVIPENVKSIGKEAFYRCEKLNKVAFMDAIKVDEEAFSFSGIKEIEIPSGSVVDGCAFRYCEKLKKIIFKGDAKWKGNISLQYTSIKKYKIPDGITKVSAGMFLGCEKLENVTIPVSVKKIERQAFQNCVKLAHIKYAGTKKQWNKIKFSKTGNLWGKFAKITTTNSSWKNKVKLNKKIKLTRVYKKTAKKALVLLEEYNNADGYQVKLVAKKHHLKKTYSGSEARSELIKGMKKGKKYKAYIRYYVIIAGKKYYSKWSKGEKVEKK